MPRIFLYPVEYANFCTSTVWHQRRAHKGCRVKSNCSRAIDLWLASCDICIFICFRRKKEDLVILWKTARTTTMWKFCLRLLLLNLWNQSKSLHWHHQQKHHKKVKLTTRPVRNCNVMYFSVTDSVGGRWKGPVTTQKEEIVDQKHNDGHKELSWGPYPFVPRNAHKKIDSYTHIIFSGSELFLFQASVAARIHQHRLLRSSSSSTKGNVNLNLSPEITSKIYLCVNVFRIPWVSMFFLGGERGSYTQRKLLLGQQTKAPRYKPRSFFTSVLQLKRHWCQFFANFDWISIFLLFSGGNVTVDTKNVPSQAELANILHIEQHQEGGYWKPQHCLSRDRVAIIIPFRDRQTHLLVLLKYLIPLLQRQQQEYWLFVVEQVSVFFHQYVQRNWNIEELCTEQSEVVLISWEKLQLWSKVRLPFLLQLNRSVLGIVQFFQSIFLFQVLWVSFLFQDKNKSFHLGKEVQG